MLHCKQFTSPSLSLTLSLLCCLLLVIYTTYLHIFSSDEKELGEDEGPTNEVESESQAEEQPQQEDEEEVVQEEEEVESEQRSSAPCEPESQPS